jgi:ABC-type uncharacterized transport system substrate-binding protein
MGVLLVGLALASVHLAEAQQGKVYHVGVLSIGDHPSLKGFRDGLKSALVMSRGKTLS